MARRRYRGSCLSGREGGAQAARRLVFAEGDGGGGGSLDAVADEEGVDGGVFTSEVAVEVGGVACASALEDGGAEAVGGGTVEDAVLLKFGECVGVEHFSPLVGVVAGGIASGEDVAEGGAGDAAVDGREDFDTLHGLTLEGDGIADGLGDGMPCHVEIAEAELTHAGVAGAELGGADDLVYEILRDRFAGLVVLGEGVEKLFLGEIILIELRGELYKVAVDGCAGERGVVAACEQTVEGVAELVEEGLNLVGGEERGAVGGGLGEVHHDAHLGTLVDTLGVDALVAESGHPCSGALAVAGEEVGVDHADEVALVVGDVEGFYVGMIYLDRVVAGELQAVELGGEAEDAVDHVVKLEIGAELLLVVAVAGVFELVGVVAVVPGADGDRLALGLGGEGGEFVHLLLKGGLIGLAELVEEFVDVRGVLGHGALQ